MDFNDLKLLIEPTVNKIGYELTDLEMKHIALMTRLDVIVNGLKIIITLVGASLGIDLGIEGGLT